MKNNVTSAKRPNIFVSHATADNQDGKYIDKLYKTLENRYKVFCSSVPKAGISYGKKLFKTINDNIKNCNIFVAIITDNYIRSAYCLYEFCIARFLQKKIISIYANKNVESKMAPLQDKDIVSLVANCDIKVCYQDSEKLCKGLALHQEHKEQIANILLGIAKTKSLKPYFGMSQAEYQQVFSYCDNEGIERFGKGQIFDKQTINEKFATAKKIYFLSTTGAGLFKTIKGNAIQAALRNGAEIIVILPDKDSTFCQDVALAECKQENYGDVIRTQNKSRIHAEFDSVFQYLNEAFSQAKQAQTVLGTITCYCSQTLLRQTVVLAIDENDNAWGWATMTMPPIRTTDSPTFSVNGQCAESSLIRLMVNHCECIKNIAIDRGEFRVISGETECNYFNNKNLDREVYWKKKRDSAITYMQERRNTYSNILIEVAAQHPLYNGNTPNKEFAGRLDCAIKLYHSFKEEEKEVYIYVPGSLHAHKGISDDISLSQAGKEYLIHKGIPQEIIYADDMNKRYKNEEGVYNSADECYVCSQIFKTHRFGRLICICSPYQTMRKTFFYLEQEIIPECYGIPSENMFHDAVSEFFHSLSTTIYEDHDWQDWESPMYIQTRQERKP